MALFFFFRRVILTMVLYEVDKHAIEGSVRGKRMECKPNFCRIPQPWLEVVRSAVEGSCFPQLTRQLSATIGKFCKNIRLALRSFLLNNTSIACFSISGNTMHAHGHNLSKRERTKPQVSSFILLPTITNKINNKIS